VDESHSSIAKSNRAIEGYAILLCSIRETPQASGAQIASGISTTEESGSTRFLCRHIKPKNRRVRGPEIPQH